MKKIAILMLLTLFTGMLVAQDQPEYTPTFSASSELALLISSSPEVKLGFTERYIFPFLQGENPLTAGNNYSVALSVEVSPISLNGLGEFVWTPIAFFQFAVGGRIGSGWNLSLFGNDIYGIGLNRPDVVGNSINEGRAFDGLLWKAHTGGTLQFDLAALYPGDWHHVVARSYHEINYRGYTRAKAYESWYYENDGGENINGFNYYGNLLVGYQMPLFFNMAALLVEEDLYLYDTPDRDRWGDNKMRWTFSGVFGFTIARQLDLTLIAQLVTRRNFLESNWQDLYYRNRTIDSSKPMHLAFYRVAAALTYRL